MPLFKKEESLHYDVEQNNHMNSKHNVKYSYSLGLVFLIILY
jgi:hypothetical protein